MSRPRKPFGATHPGRLPATMMKVLAAEMSDPQRLRRGKQYAHDGSVTDIIVEPGIVTCEVQGSRSTPYIAQIEVTAGDGMPLRRDITARCTCPDDDNWDNLRLQTRRGGDVHDERRIAPRTRAARRVASRDEPAARDAHPNDAGSKPAGRPQAGPPDPRALRSHARPRHRVRPTATRPPTAVLQILPRANQSIASPICCTSPTMLSSPTFPSWSRSNSRPPQTRTRAGADRRAPPRPRRLGLTDSPTGRRVRARHRRDNCPSPNAKEATRTLPPRGRQRLAGDRRPDRQCRSGRAGQERRDPPRPVLPVHRGSPAARRRTRHRKDQPGQGDRRLDRRHLEAGAVHPRPAAERHHRGDGLRPERRDVLLPRGPRVHQRADRRRDQPWQPEDPVGAARGDGGASGDRRRREPPRPSPVPGHRHPEPS